MHRITNSVPTGTIGAIPAKAHAHRALIAAALSTTPSTLRIAHYSKDIDATINSLRGLGAQIEKTATGVTVQPIGHQVSVAPATETETATETASASTSVPASGSTTTSASGTSAQTAPYIDAHESGTTLRLLLPVGAAIASDVHVTAAGRLPDRPLEPLKSQMEAHGVSFSAPKPPFTMSGHLQGGHFELAGHISSQFFSGLLLAAPYMKSEDIDYSKSAGLVNTVASSDQATAVTIESTTPLQSRDYVNLTIKVMKDFGVTVNTKGDGFSVPLLAQYVGQTDYAIEGDWSNSAIWLVGAALTGQPLTVTCLAADSVQADRRIIDVVRQSGATVEWVNAVPEKDANHKPKNNLNATSQHTIADLLCTGKATKPLHVDLEQMPDLLPVLAALACGIEGKSEFINGERLRLKESDRLVAVTNLVNDLGGHAYCVGDNLYIEGTGSLEGGTGDCCNDHRLVMAGTLMALISRNDVQLKDSEAITKSYPLFFEHWNQLGGNAHEL
ncbi:MAG: 3-phosphoshikimate 1-carboxyvinyltransferase [Veillonella sp.]|uniref:3-phosphoshikimate 1-carboxyvinyltransferase n=1 Tax=Veillonella sp. TaxID=1926307 RepID=UPI0025E0CE00|nr:3-phosphoshikimate 1-carboxyvinyltransferase [Veillonella sp.]MBS4913235.1 3-phosphoshikimate 1-carboxyvinyltransferase [Veillonella sp.]